MTAVYKRELRSYFNSMIGYIYIAAVCAVIGIYFMIVNLKLGYPYLANSLSSTVAIFAFAVPILTMKSIAEERKTKSDQMLLIYPVSVTGVIMGKFLAMLTVYAIPMAITCLCPLVIAKGGNGSYLIDYSTILAFMFMGALFISVGMYISSLTESQVIAAVGAMVILLVMLMWDNIVSFIPDTGTASCIGFCAVFLVFAFAIYRSTRSIIAPVCIFVVGAAVSIACALIFETWFAGALKGLLTALSINTVLINFTSYYVFDIKGLVLLAILAALFVFLTVQRVQKRRYE